MTRKWVLTAIILTLSGLSSAGSVAQAAGSPATSSKESVRIAIAGFKKLEDSARADALQRLLPGIFAAALLPYDWIQVRQIGSGVEEPSRTAKGEAAADKPDRGKSLQLELVLEGTVIARGGSIRLDVAIKDPGRDSAVVSAFEVFDENSILPSVGKLVERMAGELRKVVASSRRPGRSIVYFIEAPFAIQGESRSQAFLGAALASSISAMAEGARFERVNFKTGTVAERQGESFDALISGEFSVQGNLVTVNSTITEQSTRLTFSIQARGPEKDVYKVLKTHSERVLEIIEGRVTEDGQWKQQPALLSKATPRTLIARGDDYFRDKDYSSAILMYRKALEQAPANVEAVLALAEVYTSQNKEEKALTELARALESHPSDRSLLLTQGYASEEVGDWELAAASFEKVLALDPTDYSALIHRGFVHTARKEFGPAIKHLNMAVSHARNAKDKAQALLFLGRAHKANGELGAAIAKLRESADAQPAAGVYVELAKALQENKQRLPAIEAANRAVELDFRHVAAYQTLWPLYSGREEDSRYRDQVRQAVKRDPKFTWALAELGRMDAYFGDHDQAVKNLKEAVSRDPKDGFVHLRLADSYFELQDYQQARVHYSAATGITPTFAAYMRLGHSYKFLENYPEAEKSYREAIRLNNRDVQGPIVLSALYSAWADRGEKARHVEAVRILEEALVAIGESSALYHQLAFAHVQAKNYEKAEEAAGKSLALSKNNPELLVLLAEIRLERDQLSQALETVNSALRMNQRRAGDAGAFTALKDIYVKRRDPKGALEIIQGYAEKDPGNIEAGNTIGVIYHEHLLDFQKGYEAFSALVKSSPKNVGLLSNLAEASLTTERFDEAYRHANRLVGDPNAKTETKLAMRFVVISSLLFQEEKRANALSELGGFIRAYRSLPQDYARSWEFGGSKVFITQTKWLQEPERKLLLDLLAILESKTKPEGDKKAAQLEASLQRVLEQLQAKAKRASLTNPARVHLGGLES